jgi:uncharacterized protein (DUF433 family)
VKRATSPNPLSSFIVSDPRICHGQPTFAGTRILVADVLEQVASGLPWESIVADWRGSISKNAIAEAVRLSSQALLDHSGQYVATGATSETQPV